MRNRQVDAVLSPFAEGAAAPKAGQVAAAVRQKAPPKRSQVWGMRKRGFPPQQPNSGTRDAVSVTTIRISTCDFWATNKGPHPAHGALHRVGGRIGSKPSGDRWCDCRAEISLGRRKAAMNMR